MAGYKQARIQAAVTDLVEAVYLAIAELDEYYDLTPIEQIRQLITEDATAQMCLKSRQFQNSTYKDQMQLMAAVMDGERPSHVTG